MRGVGVSRIALADALRQWCPIGPNVASVTVNGLPMRYDERGREYIQLDDSFRFYLERKSDTR